MKSFTEFLHAYKRNYQGVIRLGVTVDELRLFLKANKRVESYLIKIEGVGTPDPHIHYIIRSNQMELKVNTFKRETKIWLTAINKAPETGKYLNGMNNISPVKNMENMAIYIQKEGPPDHIHNFPVGILEQLRKLSFLKNGIKVQLDDIQRQYLTGFLTLEEYAYKYRIIRVSFGKPDIYWYKQIQKMNEINKIQNRNDDSILEIKNEISKYISCELNSWD